MNKIYKVIFNKNTGQINVTSEVSKSSGKVKSLTSNENKETVIGEENKNNIFKLKDIAVILSIAFFGMNLSYATTITDANNNEAIIDGTATDVTFDAQSKSNKVKNANGTQTHASNIKFVHSSYNNLENAEDVTFEHSEFNNISGDFNNPGSVFQSKNFKLKNTDDSKIKNLKSTTNEALILNSTKLNINDVYVKDKMNVSSSTNDVIKNGLFNSLELTNTTNNTLNSNYGDKDFYALGGRVGANTSIRNFDPNALKGANVKITNANDNKMTLLDDFTGSNLVKNTLTNIYETELSNVQKSKIEGVQNSKINNLNNVMVGTDNESYQLKDSNIDNAYYVRANETLGNLNLNNLTNSNIQFNYYDTFGLTMSAETYNKKDVNLDASNISNSHLYLNDDSNVNQVDNSYIGGIKNSNVSSVYNSAITNVEKWGSNYGSAYEGNNTQIFGLQNSKISKINDAAINFADNLELDYANKINLDYVSNSKITNSQLSNDKFLFNNNLDIQNSSIYQHNDRNDDYAFSSNVVLKNAEWNSYKSANNHINFSDKVNIDGNVNTNFAYNTDIMGGGNSYITGFNNKLIAGQYNYFGQNGADIKIYGSNNHESHGATNRILGNNNTIITEYMENIIGDGNHIERTTDSFYYGWSPRPSAEFALGNNNNFKGVEYNAIFGNNNISDSRESIIIGQNNTLINRDYASGGLQIGNNNNYIVEGGGIVIGNDIKSVNNGYTTILGNKSNSNMALGNNYLANGGYLTNNIAGNELSVGSEGAYRAITGVAGGYEDTDAINIAQLKKLEDLYNSLNVINPVKYDDLNKDTITLENNNGESTYVNNVKAMDLEENGNYAAVVGQVNDITYGVANVLGNVGIDYNNNTIIKPFYVNSTEYDTVADAIKSEINYSKIQVNTFGDLTNTYDSQNDIYDINLNKNLNINTAKLGDGSTSMTNNLKIGNVVVENSNINAGGLKVENIGDGDLGPNSRDAISGSQLNTYTDNIAKLIGGGVTNVDGQLTGGFNVYGTQYSTVSDAIKNEYKKHLINVKSDDANLNVSQSFIEAFGGSDIDYTLNPNMNLNSVKLNNTNLNVDGLTMSSDTFITKDGVSIGTNKTLSNMADGVISSTSKDGVNVSQIANQLNSLEEIIGWDGKIVNPDGTVNQSFVVNNTKYQDIASAIEDVSKKSQYEFIGKDNIAINTNPLNSKDRVISSTKDIKNNNSLTVGDFKLTQNELNINDKFILTDNGLNLTGGQVTGIKNNTDYTTNKLLNGADIHKTNDNFVSIIGGDVKNENGSIKVPFTVNNNDYQNISDAIKKEISDLEIGSGESRSVSSGNNNIVVNKQADNTYVVSTNKDLTANKVILGTTIIEDGNLQVGSVNLKSNSIDLANNQITNLAKGAIHSSSKDLINGSQLVNSQTEIAKIIGLNGSDVNNPLDAQVIIENNSYNTVEEAILAESKSTLRTVSGINDINVTKDKNNYDLSMSKVISADSVTLGQTILNENGLTLSNGVSVTNNGINAGGLNVKNVSNGVNDKDAVNYGQLKGEIEKFNFDDFNGWSYSANGGNKNNVGNMNNVDFANEDGNINIYTGNGEVNFDLSNNIKLGQINISKNHISVGDVSFDEAKLDIKDGVKIDGKIDLNNGKVYNLADGLIGTNSKDAINGSQIYKVGKNIESTLGPDVKFTSSGDFIANNIGGTNADNVSDAIRELNNQKAKVDDVIGGRNMTVNKVNNSSGGFDFEVTLNKNANYDSLKGGDVVVKQEGIDVNNHIVTNGADGDITNTSSDSVTTGQLWKLQEKVNNLNISSVSNVKTDDGKEVKSSTNTFVGDNKNLSTHIANENLEIRMSDKVSADKLTVKKSLNVKNGANIDMGGNRVQGVSDAIADSDAVNLRQLKSVDRRLNQRIDDLEDSSNAGFATAMAVGDAPYRPGENSYSANVASYGGQSAVGLSLRTTSDNGKWTITGDVAKSTSNKGKVGVMAGFGGILY